MLQPTAEQLRIAQLTSSDVEPEVTKKINQASVNNYICMFAICCKLYDVMTRQGMLNKL